ncbi:metal-dependent hydrolase [Erythrobacter sp. HL-111]|uniref:metal-dependent hydrolase n=1 Tax=Erythrobacter sp. HL-111 TaxID=1798193 RepID=UPI0006DA9305|nr:metal-dependent hydrolase [Erythrobacter sp. HL-111]KPP96547.1 MAG: inner membrane protein [Erythrobacteraceae bacterium HL-111]SDS05129.1 inner membrane protein [Erythrobacter sp. HL-111]
MDNITHSLVGALIGQAGLKRQTGLAMPALVIGANLPDVDAACFFWLDGAEHLGFRRGITHGPVAWVVLPFLLAAALWAFDRWQDRRGTRPEARAPVDFGWLYALSLIACLTHPALDWLNVYGIRLFEPFSSAWFYGDTLFIVDVWLWALLGVSLWRSRRIETREGAERATLTAQIALALMLLYVAFNGLVSDYVAYHKAKLYDPEPEIAIASPVPLFFWQRERIIRTEDGRWYSSEWEGEAFGNGYHAPLAPVCRIPADAAEASQEARAFLFWSRAPFAERAEDGSVILRDARYYDPRARDRFSVRLPAHKCEELPAP